MNKTLRVCLLAACLSLLLGVAPAYAGPSPVDGTAQSSFGQQDVFQTALFALGEVDLSTLGVSASELLTVGPQPSLSSSGGDMIIVDDGLDCPNRDFVTIQAAVNAAAPGDTIKVCRGVYIEQVTIPAGKDGLTLFSEPAFQAIIKAPPVMTDPKAIVRVSGAQDITIRHFTITGPGGGGCDSIRYGVRVDNGGSALVTDNHITEIHDTPFSGCQNGIGVDIGRASVDGPTSGTGTVVHNLIDRYQKGGVLVSNPGSSGEVAYNEIVGAGPTPIIAQNGVQVSGGAEGDVHHNKISQNDYSAPGTESTGILLFFDPIARAHHNEVFLNDSGVTTFRVTDNTEMSYNNARNNDYGIVAYNPSSRVLITHNKAFENTVFDCRDDNAPASNDWIKDLGRTENQPGLCKQAGP
jgi:parallel beta-helix repeat protein